MSYSCNVIKIPKSGTKRISSRMVRTDWLRLKPSIFDFDSLFNDQISCPPPVCRDCGRSDSGSDRPKKADTSQVTHSKPFAQNAVLKPKIT